MYRLLEITYTNDKESVALYPTEGQESFQNETELIAEYETKLGGAIDTDTYKAELLVAFDHTGKIYAQEYHTKDASIVLSPRLVTVEATQTGEVADQSKKDSELKLEAAHHNKKGADMKDKSIKAVLLMDIANNTVSKNEYWVRPIEVTE
jgi:hypothetical protein